MDDPPVSRRDVLAGLTVAAGGIAGCASPLNAASPRPERVSMLAAGSLNNALEHGLGPTVDATLEVEAHGSAEVARLVAEGAKEPDIVAVADVALFDSPMHPEWYAEFATNSIVVAYNPATDGGKRLEAAGSEWYRPLIEGRVSLGRTDPDLDPLGYRTLFLFELATAYYGTDVDLRAAVPQRDQLYPETQLVSQFETGSIDAAIAYRSMAVERGYDYVELPPEIDLSSPAFADRYASATYDLPGGKTVRGGPISYAATIRRRSPAVHDVFERLTTGSFLREFGFAVPDDYPRYTPDAPDALAD
ncbi:extracellular solute-binding protein [Salinigranum sp. GCM10025319]|uniref:extracellular solute-binding protein n=1 Tax=Salinigranum sp. GCM10025319 TaxID=3252687 RepID=UPI00360F2502